MGKNDIDLKVDFNDYNDKRPQHMQRCLCYDSYLPGYYCYVYDDISKYWCHQHSEEHDVNGDNHVCDYADGRVTKWVALTKVMDYSELLFNDLCGRLQYKVKINHPDFGEDSCEVLDTLYNVGKNKEKYFKTDWEDEESAWHGIDRLKPYLYPMSAMSKEQKKEYSDLQQKLLNEHKNVVVNSVNLIDFFNRNHIDYNGLIDKGIGIDIRNLHLKIEDSVGVSVNEGTPSMYAVAGDICLYSKKTKKLIIVQFNDFDVKNYPLDSYTPVGVVVIPGSHDVYGTGECGVMSIVPMNCSTPDTGGTSEQGMYWGQNGTDISSLTNYDQVCHVGNNGTVNETVQGTTSYAYLPSDKFNTVQNPYDTDTYYQYNDSNYYIPSPYLTDDSRNPAYYQTSSPSSTSNALSDFDGTGNTDKIITQRGTKDYSSWTPTYNTQADYPAASCCDMYYTDGTKQGDWYLPACGELGYIMPKFNQIQQTISTLNTAYGVGVQLFSSDYYWSSSEYSSNYARGVHTSYGYVDYYYKGNGNSVRAFLRVGA